MKILGLYLALLLVFGALVTQGGILPASAIEPVPLAPRNLNASPVSDSQIFLIWNAPINASGIIGYKIEYKIGSGSYSTLGLIGNLTTYLHTGLTTNTTYTYRVSAINSVGIGNQSNTATVTTLAVPLAPRNLSATVISSSQINLAWTAPSNDGGTVIKGYKILRENSCTGSFVAISTTHNPSTVYSDTGLAANTCYLYNIQAINAIGVGSIATSNVTATTAPAQTHTPNSPTRLDVTAISNTSLKLTWSAPSNDGGSKITGYLIQRNGTTIVTNTSSNKTSYADTSLLSSHKQTYRVAAWNSVGLGTFSNSISGITDSIFLSGNGTNQTSNLGQLISDLEHQRNQLLKQQRQETLALIHDCHTQIKNTSSDNKTQIAQDCKAKIKESRDKYKELRNQLKTELATLKSQFKLQTHEDKNEDHSDNETGHSENGTKNSENKTHQSEDIKDQFKIKSEKQNDEDKNNQGKHNKQGNDQDND